MLNPQASEQNKTPFKNFTVSAPVHIHEGETWREARVAELGRICAVSLGLFLFLFTLTSTLLFPADTTLDGFDSIFHVWIEARNESLDKQ